MVRKVSFLWLLLLVPIIAITIVIAVNSDKDKRQIHAIVELAIVCDKAFGDLFQHNRTRILEYWTVFLADLSMRFKSLPSSAISFRITSVTVTSSAVDQPWIENVRGVNDTVNLGSVIGEFAKWAYRKRKLLTFDVAMAVTSVSLEGNTVGIAYSNGACLIDHNGGRHSSIVVISDRGTWSVGAAAHELGHLLGAPHDADIAGCHQTGFLMSGLKPKTQYFFSKCSDIAINDFLKSEQSSCLKRIDHQRNAVLPVLGIIPPTMEVQCQRLFQSIEGSVYKDGSNCQQIKCARYHKDSYTILQNHYPVDGSPCQVDKKQPGSCFRGTCLPLGFRLANLASGKCLRQGNPFSMDDKPIMVPCAIDFLTPLDQFYLLGDNKESNLKLLATPYSVAAPTNLEKSAKCLQVTMNKNNENISFVNFVSCAEYILPSILAWHLIDVDQDTRILANDITGQCLGYDIEYSQVVAYKNCNKNDPRILWKLNAVLNSTISDDDDTSAQTGNSRTKHFWIYFLIACSLVCLLGAIALIISGYFNKTKSYSSDSNNGLRERNTGESFELIEQFTES